MKSGASNYEQHAVLYTAREAIIRLEMAAILRFTAVFVVNLSYVLKSNQVKQLSSGSCRYDSPVLLG